MEILGERIVLRDYTLGDAATVVAYQRDPRYLEHHPPEGEARISAEELVDLFLRWARERPRRNFQLAVIDRGTGLLIGSCGLRGNEMAAGSAEFGLELAPEAWGRGLATEAARLLLSFGFESLELEKVLGISVTENTRVARLVRKLGFADNGTRSGEEWMQARGWTYTEWLLDREALTPW